MTLDEIATGRPSVPLQLIGADRQLAQDVQSRLADIGVLDPPSDGSFGPVSHWALTQVLKRLTVPVTTLDTGVARALIAAAAAARTAASSAPFPLNVPASLAGKIVAAMQAEKYWICRHPETANVVYVEGMDPDGKANDDAPNVFNDLRVVLRVNRVGNPEIVEAWEATSEPGKHYTAVKKLHPRGAARIAFGQYKAWSVGTHNATSSTAHEALVQTADINVHRDFNEDFERINDEVSSGVFGINQHWGFDLPKSDIGKASAGCLVGRTKAGHRAFMSLCKADPRYVANNSYRFMTAVLPATSVVGGVL